MVLKTNRGAAQAGFSFIEIIVGILIMGVLAGVGLGAMKYLNNAKRTKTEAALKSLQLAIENYQIDTGSLPTQLNDLVERPADAKVAKLWKDQYVQARELRDGYGHDFVYQVKPKGSRPPYDLYSFGPKGEAADAQEYIHAHDL